MNGHNSSTRTKRFTLWCKAAFLGAACALVSSASAQTVQIDPAGAGGFELGATFAANGWTVQNGAQTNKWLCSTGASGYTGARCAYISKNTTANNYNRNVASTVHMYRDVSFPATETAITFTARCKQKGETDWDRLLVYISTGNPSGTPAAGTPASGGTTLAGYELLGVFPSHNGWTNYAIPLTAAQAGNAAVTTSRRILFTWQNDGSGGTQPPAAIDDISLSSAGAPPPAPCLSASNGQYPGGATTLACSGVPEDVSNGCGWAGEYSKVNLTSGEAYIFTSSNANDWITISNNAGTLGYAYGPGQVNYTASATATYRFYTHTDASCGEENVCRIRYVQCGGAPPPPANNDCSSPTSLTVGANGSCPGSATAGTSVGATGGAAPYPTCLIPNTVDVWYSFNSGSNTAIEYNVVLGTQSAFGAQVLTACGGTEVYCVANTLSGSFPVTANTNYLFRVLTLTPNAGTFSICLQAPPTPPANNDCGVNPVVLTVGANGSCPAGATAGTTVNATGGAAPYPSCLPTGLGLADVWYSFNSGANTSIEHNIVLGTQTTFGYQVLTACGGTEVACGDGIPTTPLSVTPFTNYVYRLMTLATTTGTFSICLQALPSPACNGGYTAPANGSSMCSDGSTATLSWPSVTDAGAYDVYFDNAAGTTLVSADQTATTYTTAALGIGTYSWRIVPKNGSGSPAGPCPTWTFTRSTPPTWYADADADGFGDPAVFVVACTAPPGYVANSTDNCPTLFGLIGDACDDGNPITFNDVINGSCVCAGTLPAGCMDPLADNYDPNAAVDDGSCTFCAPTITYDTPIPTPITIGSGIPADHAAVSVDCHPFTVGMEAFLRFGPAIVPAGNVYTTTVGHSPVSGNDPTPDPVLARWNILGSVDLGAYDFTQVNVFLDLDFDPGAVPVWNTLDLSQAMINNSLGNEHVYQAAENLASPFWTVAFPGVTFDPDVPGTYDVRVRLESPTSNTELLSMSIQIVVEEVTYYSQASGNVSDPIWDKVPVGTPGPAYFGAGANMVVQNGNTVTNTTDVDVKDVTVETGGTLALNASTNFKSHGNGDFSGTLTANDNSTLSFLGTGAVVVTSTNILDLFNLTANVPNGLNTAANFLIRGTLQLEDGDFDVSAGSLTLSSTASGTGRLGSVAATASYTGDMTVQRYIPAGHTNWRMLGSPVAGQKVINWKDDFYTAGFPGSHYPNFYSPVGSGILWPSIRYYDETLVSGNANNGVVGVTDAQQALSMGQGFQAWSGDNFSTTTAFTLDVKGAPHIAQTPITLPMSFTSSGTLVNDGWNLVSNPVPSPIDFTLMSRGADVQNAYWIFDPIAGNLKAWTNGVGQGSLNGILQSSQGFYLKADGVALTTTVSESAKVEESTGGTFGGSENAVLPILNLTVTSSLNTYSDEATIVFANGTPDYDAMDALKFTFKTVGAPQVSILSNDGQNLAVDFYGDYASAIQIPVLVNADITGTYTLSASISGIDNLSCLSIEDLQTGTVTALADGATYSFTINEDDDATSPRFMLNGTAPIPLVMDNAICSDQDGTATVVVNEGPVDIQWTDVFGNVLLTQANVAGGVAEFQAPAGDYIVRVTPGGACGELVADFTITAPEAIEAVMLTSATTCPNGTDGTAELVVMGGTAPFAYLWSDGNTGDNITGQAGNYTVTITDANGCTELATVMVPAGEGTIASFEMDGTTAMANIPVDFTNTTVFGEDYTWDFGDGATSTDVNATHTWTLPGTYTVTLTATGGDCSDVFTMELTVDATTAIEATTPNGPLAVWGTPDHIVIEHSFNNSPVDVDVYDATGRLAISRGSIVKPGRILINDHSLSTGVWFVRVTSGDVQRSFRVPLIR